jgi:putative flippase GtrA
MTSRKEIFNFIRVGVVNTIFYYLIYISILGIGLNYLIAILIATILGIIFNFKTFGKYVFLNEDKSRFYIFVLAYFVLYIINLIFVNIFNYWVNNYYLSGFMAIFPYAFFSFYINKKFVFHHKGE